MSTLISTFVRRLLRMAVWTQQAQVTFYVIVRIPIYMVQLKRDGFIAPFRQTTTFAYVTTFKKQASLA